MLRVGGQEVLAEGPRGAERNCIPAHRLGRHAPGPAPGQPRLQPRPVYSTGKRLTCLWAARPDMHCVEHGRHSWDRLHAQLRSWPGMHAGPIGGQLLGGSSLTYFTFTFAKAARLSHRSHT